MSYGHHTNEWTNAIYHIDDHTGSHIQQQHHRDFDHVSSSEHASSSNNTNTYDTIPSTKAISPSLTIAPSLPHQPIAPPSSSSQQQPQHHQAPPLSPIYTNGPSPFITAQMAATAAADAARVVWYGRLLLVGMMLWFVLACWAVFMSKLMPTTGHALLDAIAHDRYYSLLVPLSIPATFIAIYLNWLGLKLFRHN